ncbi:MAG: DUF1887 family protein [Planctomycetota bacterium]|nr:DUF1887 family protein [Planctomycetota bacterium]
MPDSERCDVMFHLGGEHMQPNLILARLLRAPRNVVVVSPQTREAGGRLALAARRGRGGFPAEVECAEIDQPHDPVAAAECVRRLIAREAGRRIVVNITGGTKPMAFAALSNAQGAGLPCAYLDVEERRLHLLDGSGWHSRDISAEPPPLDIDDFVDLSGYSFESGGCGSWAESGKPDREARAETTARLWKNRTLLQREQGEMVKIAEKQKGVGSVGGVDKRFFAEKAKDGARRLLLNGREEAGAGEWPDFWNYLAGTWLEEYAYLKLRPLVGEGGLTDLRIDVGLRAKDRPGRLENANAKPTLNQLDLVFTDGWRLWIVECKAGRCSQEHVQKLENLVRRVGGMHGRGCLLLVGEVDGRGSNGFAAALRRTQESRSGVFCFWVRGRQPGAKRASDIVPKVKPATGEFGKALRQWIMDLESGWCCELET